jgi:predicted acetyltransferase
MKLMKPQAGYQTEFDNFYTDLLKNDPENAEFYARSQRDFVGYLNQLEDEALGRNLPEGYVPCFHLWAVVDDNIVGVIRIRHNIEPSFLKEEAGHIGYDVAPSHRKKGYATQMLKLALPIAASVGIESALVCADESNRASRKVIENNKGVLEEIIVGKVYQSPIARYWVDVNQC